MDNTEKTLAVFGDSIINGSGNGDFGVGEYLAKDMGFKLLKYCVGGARMGFRGGKSWIIEQIQYAVKDGISPDYVVFDGFTNDCHVQPEATEPDVPLGDMSEGYAGFDLFKVQKDYSFSRCFEEAVCAMLTYFPKAKILFIRPHNMGRRDDALQRAYGERALNICKKWGVPFVDLYSESAMNTFIPVHRDAYTADSYGWGTGDSTHPNALGYELKYMPLIEAKIKTL